MKLPYLIPLVGLGSIFALTLHSAHFGLISETQATVAGTTQYAVCGSTTLALTATQYADLGKASAKLPSSNGAQCTSAVQKNKYNTPSGDLEPGYYYQDSNGKYESVMQTTFTTATGTYSTTTFLISDIAPTQSTNSIDTTNQVTPI
jgi:hypothetical protein